MFFTPHPLRVILGFLTSRVAGIAHAPLGRAALTPSTSHFQGDTQQRESDSIKLSPSTYNLAPLTVSGVLYLRGC